MTALQSKLSIRDAITQFSTQPLRSASLGLFASLGYQSDRTIAIHSVEDFCTQFDPSGLLEHARAQKSNWKSIHLLFQLTDEELSRNATLFKDTAVRASLLQSYVFFAVELQPGDYARGKLAAITRQINRIFPMPVMVLFKVAGNLSIAVINRRQNRRDESKDVLGKVTLIQNISTVKPHPGHLDILASFSTTELLARKKPISNFDQLHAAWEDVFNVELLNKRFYEELSNWYFWARKQVSFPADLEPDVETRNATSVIRLLTRLIFCWFLKEKDLIPDHLFDQDAVTSALNSVGDEESTYYHAILQNLFFATLNQPMNADGEPVRQFAADGDFQENRSQHGVKTLYRYKKSFRDPANALALFEDIPFLNGGLFACLDTEDDTGKVQYADGFSRNAKKQPVVPNRLFFAAPHVVDLSEDFGDAKKKKANVRGLLHILHGYKFTIAESTPVEQEIALDPELLGNVFENLLASYNPETGTNARRQTGSFYTPRPIVDYMVDESLKAYLADALVKALPTTTAADAKAGLEILFAYTEKEHAFCEVEIDALITAINACNILDPACGSGAYPMGILHKLVFILGKLDPHNEKWHQRQVAKAEEIEDVEARASSVQAIDNDFANNALDYGRKLYLIENCIYGADIQPIAIQIAKLRFFIALICDQRTHNDKARNLGVRPLPNLETKFVVANTLLGLDTKQTSESMANTGEIKQLKAKLSTLRHRYFSAQTRKAKRDLQKRDQALRKEITDLLDSMGYGTDEEHRRIAWNPYDHHSVADFFDPGKMFGPALDDGFDVVIGNPPYVQIQKFKASDKAAWVEQKFKTYAASADIYCLFYERGVRILKDGGHLSYITSNKWMRAGYGEALRQYLAEDVETQSVMDFGMAQNFGAATTYTCIVQLAKRPSSGVTRGCYVADDKAAMADPSDYFEHNALPLKGLDETPWVILPAMRQRIKLAVEEQGVPLEKWQIQINYGIKTGNNDAFYISTAQREEFITEDQRCAEFIVPLLRGRYVGRYATQWASAADEKWMIATFPALDLKFDNIPVPIQRHLEKYRESLEPKPRDWVGSNWQGRKAGSYQWFETQDPIAYHADFFKPKIIYPNMTKYLPFYFDQDDHFFGNQKCFIITSDAESLLTLTAVLNSNLFRCCFKDDFPELLGSTYELSKIFFDKIPIKKPTTRQAALFEMLVPMVQAAKAESQKSGNSELNSVAVFLEEVIDACVMEVYFADHMAEHRLGIMAHVLPLLQDFDAAAPPARQVALAQQFYAQANDSKHPIRNILIRIPVDSPDLLAVIQREGAV